MPTIECRPEPRFDEVHFGTDQPIYSDHDEYLRDLLAWHREETTRQLKESGSSRSGGFYGIGFGSALAMILSFELNHSVGWAILHGICSWLYVIYRVWQGNY
jgi:hypothetical protein